MGYHTDGHIRCQLKTSEAAQLLEAAFRRQVPPSEWMSVRTDEELALYEAACGLRVETFRRAGSFAEVCMSFDARDGRARSFMSAVRSNLRSPVAGDVWGYLVYQGDASPFELFASRSMTMQHPEPDIVVHG